MVAQFWPPLFPLPDTASMRRPAGVNAALRTLPMRWTGLAPLPSALLVVLSDLVHIGVRPWSKGCNLRHGLSRPAVIHAVPSDLRPLSVPSAPWSRSLVRPCLTYIGLASLPTRWSVRSLLGCPYGPVSSSPLSLRPSSLLWLRLRALDTTGHSARPSSRAGA